MKKNLIRALIAIVVLGAIVFAFYKVTHKSSAFPEGGNPDATLTPLPSVTPLSINYGTTDASWTTYASASAGFTVKYPHDWTVTPCGSGCVSWAPPGQPDQPIAGITVSEGTLSTVLDQAGPYLVASESLKVGSVQWLKLSLQQPTTGDLFTTFFVQHGTKIYEVGVSTIPQDTLDQFGALLKSFTFTK